MTARAVMSSARPQFSVVIPAHNEEAVLARCLDALLEGTRPGQIEIVVAVNGSGDRTKEIAESYGPPVIVIETEQASKHVALNAGDARATVFPRAYVDADIAMSSAAISAVAQAMRETGALVGAPKPRIDLEGCHALTRSFYRVWRELPWFADNPIGSGVYILSEEGHRRLGSFPDITNDDQYVHDLFVSAERVCVRSHEFTVRVPRTLEALVRRRTRTLHGQRELAARFGTLPGASPRLKILDLLRRRPALAADLLVFVGVTLASARRADRKTALGDTGWERDNSTRTAPAV
jgi:glycosyltransferase involved in cell wall biosynthesis